MYGVGYMHVQDNHTAEKRGEPNVTHIEYNGRAFEIIEHFSGEQTFLDIVKNALRREFHASFQTLENSQTTCSIACPEL
jgi:sarcosine oxidase delta subunit